MAFNTIEEALAAIAEGKFIIVADDEHRENEGDLIMAADLVTPESIAFIVRYCTGIICVSLTEERLNELHLPQMVVNNTEVNRTAFTVSVDYKVGTSTGVSAGDRAATIKALVDPEAKINDFQRPGHIFPLRYREGGVLTRAGHTEAALDLARMAGCAAGGVLCELNNDDGSMMRMPDLEKFAETHDLILVTVADLIKYRRKKERLLTLISQSKMPTRAGDFSAYVYESKLDEIEHIALVKGDVRGKENVLVRVHSECLTGDVLGSKRCDCGNQLNIALERIAEEGEGILIYLRGHEGRGIGLGHKIKAYNLQDQGFDTVEANIELGLPVDSREYGAGAQILDHLGVKSIRLLTNNPAKYAGLAMYDVKITERLPLISKITEENYRYLLTKKEKLGHMVEPKVHDEADDKVKDEKVKDETSKIAK